MTFASFQDFEAGVRAEGFSEVVVRDYAPHAEVPTHTHPFAVKAVVVNGEMWLTCGDETRHLLAGDGFELDHLQQHAERYGSGGATFWVGRRTEPWA